MSNDLKETWKKTGIGLGHAFRDLGKSIIKSGATAVRKADEWANKEDYETASSPDSAPAQDTTEEK